jgi:two-component system sensor histidine kinase RegB
VTDALNDTERSNWLRLRTLVLVRWVAILGQAAAIVVASSIYGFRFQYGAASIAIGASVLTNLFLGFLYPTNRRMTERETALMLGFDLIQLAALLYLTGGLNNPFALLMLAPVTIAATVLHLRSTAALAMLTLAAICAMALWHLPIRTEDGSDLVLPPLFRFGFFLALTVGVLFLSLYARQVTTEMHVMREALVATRLALAREQKLTDLGGVVAAAAHELGTPLATIKLVSTEMIEALADDPDLREDAELIRSQADRCRDILRSMGRAGNDDLHLRRAPFETVVRESAEPHLARGKEVTFRLSGTGPQPMVFRRPEIIHGLRNLIQNAVDFAHSRVEVDLGWTAQDLTVRITDDGPGFVASVLARIGDPFVHRRLWDDGSRPDYEGMGLGLFIAKTLLERTGARLRFANGEGAIVAVLWPAARIVAPADALGPNPALS